MSLPQRFSDWFSAQGWEPRPHQLAVLAHAAQRESVLLISPTGGGKTLAGFLPSLIEISGRRDKGEGMHTLYISPLKALAVDIARNLETPVREMGLDVTIETRTGDTPHAKRLRQRQKPPDILITTPEQVSLLVADPHAAHMLKALRVVILDELHAMVTSKRGVLLSLALSRVQTHAPEAIRIGLSATVADPDALRSWLVPSGAPPAPLVLGRPGARPRIRILASVERVPWSGHSALYAIPEVYAEIKRAKMTLVFVNTRSQAEVVFQALWEANDDHLPIALHHGSLDVAQRRKVEAAMGEGRLRAVVCTSTLELGIDWGDVDLVVHVGAPKGSSRLLQRIGRSNHRLDLPSEALLVPSNRFEVLECVAALHAAEENAQDTDYPMVLKLDVLAQHVLGRACAGPFAPGQLFAEVTSAWTYRHLTREDFDRVLDYVATGGYALRAYERYAKLKPLPDGTLRLAHPRLAQVYRLNMGTIIEDEMLKVRLAHIRRRLGKRVVTGGRVLGEVEEWFASQLTTGATFLFAGEVLRFEGLDEFGALASRSNDKEPMVPSYQGGKFPLSTYLAERVREMLSNPAAWKELPPQVRDWLSLQKYKSVVPKASQMLVETFPRASNILHGLLSLRGPPGAPDAGHVADTPAGTGRPPAFGLRRLRICPSDLDAARHLAPHLVRPAVARPALRSGHDGRRSRCLARRIRPDEAHLPQRRDHRRADRAPPAGPGEDGPADDRQHRPDLRRAPHPSARSRSAPRRLGRCGGRADRRPPAGRTPEANPGKIVHRALDVVSPLSVPVMLEIGRESVYGEAHDALLAEAADALIDEAMRLV